MLGGRLEEQRNKAFKPLPGDLMHTESRLLIEIDEVQHFTPFRMATLSLYPRAAPLGFDLGLYENICFDNHRRALKYFMKKPAVGFGPHGRGRQRAYHDFLRDVVAPSMGWQPVLRIPVLNDDGGAAFLRTESALRDALSGSA